MTELRVEYHQRLNDIDAAVQRILSLVEQDILNAGTALLDADEKAADAVEANERIVEESYGRVEQLVVNQFARQAPVASELRFLLAVFRILPELAASHDRAAQLAPRGVTGLAAELPDRVRLLIKELVDAAAEMWRQVSAVYLSGSAQIADDTEEDDDELDELHASLSAELASTGLRTPVLLEMGVVAALLERLGDSAVEIARQIESLSPTRHDDGAR
ncbi:phosphate signaling complex PhoU family protein [Mycobacterium sp.]|uniref:phosphate signaling complex PhoU family protein n=1 Tax=Mycobacterium sp. TaxID=1785 RepID=UPI002B728937|nr:PhoU domain-containing protein [Mycobacterium sp.]HME48496.1 PhoU domain-containing protein [Mycobacterium sp.]